MSSASSNAPPAPGDQYRDAIEGYRASVKWVVSSFGTVAAALIVGVQLTSLGQLKGDRLFWAFVSVAAVFIAILSIIMAAVRVLTPIGGTYEGFNTGREFGALRAFLQKDAAPLRGKATTAGELADAYNKAVEDENTALLLHQSDKTNTAEERKYTEARDARANLFQVVRTVTALGLFLRTKQLFQQTIRTIYVGIAVAAAGAVAFAYLANPPAKAEAAPSKTEAHVTVSLPTNCVSYYLELDALADDEPKAVRTLPAHSLDAPSAACGLGSRQALEKLFASLAAR